MSRPSDRQRLRARVYGRVQGVGYRQFVHRTAVSLELVGYVRNEESDGSVEVLAEGPTDVLRMFLKRLSDGPLMSRVESVDTRWEPISGAFAEFQIRQ
ncbi:MAG: acylphosphatase [Chloroflexota bacterium]|nr:acylphosphatase [Chloroflexota bacterium]MDE2930933.1 acylphosphatase [Chloroflexota bacterium]